MHCRVAVDNDIVFVFKTFMPRIMVLKHVFRFLRLQGSRWMVTNVYFFSSSFWLKGYNDVCCPRGEGISDCCITSVTQQVFENEYHVYMWYSVFETNKWRKTVSLVWKQKCCSIWVCGIVRWKLLIPGALLSNKNLTIAYCHISW